MDLLGPVSIEFTAQQHAAIIERDGDLLLDAGAGSGKTRVLTERFARAVEEDGIAVGEMLTITFTEKAAAELRGRIRTRLQQGTLPHTALETEGAWISTIHGFCARVLRAHALAAGLDPQFAVLDVAGSDQIARAAFTTALAQAAATPDGRRLISASNVTELRASVSSIFDELRSRGLEGDRLPHLPPDAGTQIDAAAAGAAQTVVKLAAQLTTELQAAKPGKLVDAALEMLEQVLPLLAGAIPWPGELDRIKLRKGAGALKTELCDDYREALENLRTSAADTFAVSALEGLNTLLGAFAARYRQLKRERSVVDFEDLQLIALQLLRRPEIGELYRRRFRRVMVDETQDTNALQFQLIDAVAADNVFMVGDAQQSIYGFRHADVELFRDRGRQLSRRGRRLQLTSNFRSDPQLLAVINQAFSTELGDDYLPLDPGLPESDTDQPLVELILVPKESEAPVGDAETTSKPLEHWRIVEAKALASRIAELIRTGAHTPEQVVVLTRATTDMQLYEQALAEQRIPTYVIGGRGYWEQPQVFQLVSYLKALCNRADSDALQTALISPLCGLSLDGLVLRCAGAADELDPADRTRLRDFMSIYESQRTMLTAAGAEALLHEVITATDFDLRAAALAGGRRRLANIRKLLRLARDHEAEHGPDLRGFLDWIELHADEDAVREPEAPLSADGIDAVRLMTIHASKGLEFPVVCVADLGRERRNSTGPMVRIGADNRTLGLLIKAPGQAGSVKALAYEQIERQQQQRELQEERRLFYVGMTRAESRLIISGAANLSDPSKNGSAPVGWIAAALQPIQTIARQPLGAELPAATSEPASALPQQATAASTASHAPMTLFSLETVATAPILQAPPLRPAAPVASLSYTALSTYEHCRLRFQARYVYGLPETARAGVASQGLGAGPEQQLAGASRGSAIHELLATIDLKRPLLPADGPANVLAPVSDLLGTDTFARIRKAPTVRREQPFAFQADGLLMNGLFDVMLPAPGGRQVEVIDYKSDALADASPAQLTQTRYSGQLLIYAIAALRTGAERVTLRYLFLERPDEPARADFASDQLPSLLTQLSARTAPLRARDFTVTQTPGRMICDGCPARGTICPHPYELTLS